MIIFSHNEKGTLNTMGRKKILSDDEFKKSKKQFWNESDTESEDEHNSFEKLNVEDDVEVTIEDETDSDSNDAHELFQEVNMDNNTEDNITTDIFNSIRQI